VIELRNYQAKAIGEIRNSYRLGHRAPLLCAPCGAGKTVIFAHVVAGARARGTKVLLLAHRIELVEQISAALTREDCPHGFIAAGYEFVPGHDVYVGSVFTVAKRLDAFTPDLTVVDEAHHCVSRTTWGRVVQAYPQAKILGVTATPTRLSGEGLDQFFDDLIQGPTHDELIRQGYLTPVRVYAPPTVDTEGMHTRYGDYIAAEIIDRCDRPTVTGDCIEHYRRYTEGARCVVFDVSREAAHKRAEAFRAAGFAAECIDGETPRDIRTLAVAAFRAGRIQILVSVDLISEGFDLDAIEVGICLRPTKSLTLWLQQAGRILRPLQGKTCAVLFDHAGNVFRHGLPTESRSWSLAGAAKVAHGDLDRRSLRTCPTCFAVSPAAALVCRSCGAIFPVQPRKVAEVRGSLEELSADALILKRKRKEQGSAQTLSALIDLGKRRGMKNPYMWAHHVMRGRAAKRRIG